MSTSGTPFGSLLLTGLRRSELLSAKWSDIDWKQRTLLIPKTKNGEALLAPLSRPPSRASKPCPGYKTTPTSSAARSGGSTSSI